MNNNPFMMFPNPNGGGGPGPFGPNPFAQQQMVFEISAIHDQTGATKEGLMQVSIPCNATELHARKMILEMGYQCGWSFKFLKRLDGQNQGS